MYGAVREHQGPTGVTHALRGRFGTPGQSAWGIVFVKSSSLELYHIYANARLARLSLLAVASVPSAVFSAAALRRPSAPSDFLWLGFSSLRVAALAWDASVHDWHTLQAVDLAAVLNRMAAATKATSRDQQRPMSSVPGDEHRVLIRGRYSDQSPADLRVDDKGRCVAVLAKQLGLLVVLPMRSDADLSFAATSPTAVVDEEPLVHESEMFSVDLKDEYGVANVKDFVFLDDSFEPTIVLLHEPKRTWAGRVAVLRNTAELIAISVDLRNRTHAKAWEMKSLPSDADRVVGVPGSAGGGVLVFSPNVLMQVRHEACAAGLSLNSFGDVYAKEMQSTYGAIVKSETLMSLDSARCAFLDFNDRSTAMLSLKGGELYHLTVAGSGRSGLSMVRCGSSSIASAIVPVNHRFFVLASRIGDSDLIEFCRSATGPILAGEDVQNGESSRDPAREERTEVSIAVASADAKRPAIERGDSAPSAAKKSSKRRSKKRRRTAEEEAEYEMLYGTKPPPESDSESEGENGGLSNTLALEERDEGTRGVYDDEDELELGYGLSASDAKANGLGSFDSSESWSLSVRDRLPCYGPSADFAIGKVMAGDYEGTLDMVVAGGYAKNGCLGILQHALRPEKTLEFEVEGVTQSWTVREPRLSRQEATATAARIAMVAAKNKDITARNAKQKAVREAWISERVKQGSAVDAAHVAEQERSKNEEAEAASSRVGAGDRDPADPSPSEEEGAGEPKAKRFKSDETDRSFGSEVKDVERIPRLGGGSQDSQDAVKETKPAASASSPSPHESGGGSNEALSTEYISKVKAEADALFPMESVLPDEPTVIGLHDVHSYLLLSGKTSTAVMSTMHGLDEVDSKTIEFITDMPTVAAGNMLHYAVIAQVYSRGARLLQAGKVVAEHSLAVGSPAVLSAQVSDPFILLLLANGSLVILKVNGVKKPNGNHSPDSAHIASGCDAEIGSGVRDENGGNDRSDIEQAADPEVDYENVSLSVHFSLEPDQAGNRISSACIYRGALGKQASRRVMTDASGENGVTGKPSDGAGAEAGEDALGIAASNFAGTGCSGDVSGASALDDMDEEERMLYGDAGVDDDETGVNEVNMASDSVFAGKVGVPGDDGNSSSVPGEGVTEGYPSKSEHSEHGVLYLQESCLSDLGDENCLLVTATKDGALEMRSMAVPASYEVVFRCELFFFAPQIVIDDGREAHVEDGVGGAKHENGEGPAAGQTKSVKAKKKDRIVSLVMAHITGTTLVPGLSCPLLVAVQASGFPLVYRAFLASDVPSNGLLRSRLRLSRVACGRMTTRMLQDAWSGSGSASTPVVPFANISERGGVFVGGKAPFFLFAERGFPRAHPLRCAPISESPAGVPSACNITSFAEFHGFDCSRGFVYVSSGGIVRRAELPSASDVTTDAPIPFRKVVLRCTPHKIAYHAATQTYGILASMPTPTTRRDRLARMLKSLEKHDKRHYESTVAQAEAEKGDEGIARVPPLFEELHEVRVYSPEEGWESVRVEALGVGEVGLSIGNISVDVYKRRSASTGVHIPSTNKAEDGGESLFAASQRLRAKNLLVVGTGFLNGEDATSRGRLMMFEVSRLEVSKGMDPDGKMRTHTSYQLQAIAQKELPGPVTAVAPMEGYVIAGVGPQLGVYKLVKDDTGFEIVHLSFAFGQLFCTSIASVKQYVVSADMYKSVSFHFFRDRNTSVNFLGKDYSHNKSYATEYLIDGPELSILLSDGEGNLQLLNYAHASVPESRGGKRLLLNGGINFGSRINKFQRVRLTDLKLPVDSHAGKHATMFVTLDGGIGAILPVSETQFDQLKRLSDVMVCAPDIPRHGGLDPKDARSFRPASNSTQTLHQRLIDTRLALEALSLSPAQIRAYGTRAEMTLEELGDLFTFVDSGVRRF